MCAAHAFRRVLSSRPLPAVHVPMSPVPMAVGDAHVKDRGWPRHNLTLADPTPGLVYRSFEDSRNEAAVPVFPMLRAGAGSSIPRVVHYRTQ